MPKIPRYIQNQISTSVPSMQPSLNQDVENINKAFQIIGEANNAYVKFQENTSMVNNSIKFEKLANEHKIKYQELKASSPDLKAEDYKKSLTDMMNNLETEMPTYNSKSAFRGFAQKKIEDDHFGMMDWAREQSIRNQVQKADETTENIKSQVAMGSDLTKAISDLNNISKSRAIAVRPDLNAEFLSKSINDLSFNHGMAVINGLASYKGMTGPDAIELKLKQDPNYSKGMRAEEINRLIAAGREKKEQNRISNLRDRVRWDNSPIDFYLDKNMISPIADITSPAVTKQLEDRHNILVKNGKPTSDLMNDVELNNLENIYQGQSSFEGKRAVLSTLVNKSPNEQVKRTLLSQLIKKNHVMGLAASYEVEGNKEVADRIIKGDTYIKQNPTIADFSQKSLDRWFDSKIKTSDSGSPIRYMTSNQIEQLKNTAKYVYASRLAEGATSGPSSVYQSSIESIVGKPESLNGQYFFPFRKDDKTFATKDEVSSLLDKVTQQDFESWGIANTVKGGPIEWDRIKDDIQLNNVGQNKYVLTVEIAGTEYELKGQNGKSFILDMQNLYRQKKVGK